MLDEDPTGFAATQVATAPYTVPSCVCTERRFAATQVAYRTRRLAGRAEYPQDRRQAEEKDTDVGSDEWKEHPPDEGHAQ